MEHCHEPYLKTLFSLRRLDEHELTGPQGYWFVEPRERGVHDAAHSAVVALFLAWLLGVSRVTHA